MTRIHTILLASLALILAFGVCVPQAQAENGHFGTAAIRVAAMPDAVPAVTSPLIQQGMTAMGPNPPTYGPPPSWPCIPAAAPCSSDPAGGMLVATPEEVFTVTNCESTAGCGELWWTFQTSASLTCPTAGCPISVAITAKQGTNTVYSLPLTSVGTIPSPASVGGPYVDVIYAQQGFGITNWGATVDPTAGNVTITVTTQVTAGTTTRTKVKAKGTLVVAVQ